VGGAATRRRGNTLLNTQGHHVTAHVAIEEAVREKLAGYRLQPALTNLVALAQAPTPRSTEQVKPVTPFKTTRHKADDDDEWSPRRGRR
jgi:hypothetical protein